MFVLCCVFTRIFIPRSRKDDDDGVAEEEEEVSEFRLRMKMGKKMKIILNT